MVVFHSQHGNLPLGLAVQPASRFEHMSEFDKVLDSILFSNMLEVSANFRPWREKMRPVRVVFKCILKGNL